MSKPNILVIDDDEEICREVTDALSHHGFNSRWTTGPGSTATTAYDGADIILLDLAMPEADGFEVIQALSRIAGGPHLVVASGHSARIIKAAVRSADRLGVPVLGILAKPYSVHDLMSLLDGFYPASSATAPDDAALVRRLVKAGSLLDHVQVAFQTKRWLHNAEVAGHEALLRLNSIRPISPELVFEDTVDLAAQLQVTERVLDEAMRFASTLLADGLEQTVSVNCSPALICAPQFMPMLSHLLERWSLPPKLVVIELTQHQSLRSLDAIATATSRLALRGCGIAIDDFGRGTTSLERLLMLPITELKIDKEIFLSGVEGCSSRKIIEEVIGFCRAHNIRSTVVGIETDHHLSVARDLGADFGQGFLWGRAKIPSYEPRRGVC